MKDQLSCIIVDDDPMSIKIMEAHVAKTAFLEHTASFSNSIEAAAALRDSDIDLVFLDVEMPEMSGLDLIKTLEHRPEIILVTSQKDYALEAFELAVSDFLLKPVDDYSRFLKACLKVQKELQKEKVAVSGEDTSDNIFLKIDSLLVNFKMNEILWIEAYGDYVKVHTSDKVHVVYSTLKAVAENLPSSEFVRIHRSYIVRIDQIKNIDAYNLQIENHIIPISKSYKSDLLEKIKTL